jgi:hypothetical protein
MNAVAEQAGISSVALERLIRGEVSESVAEKIGGTNAIGLQRFIDGGTSVGLAARLKCSEVGLKELREVIGRQGAIGLLIGLCLPLSAPKK